MLRYFGNGIYKSLSSDPRPINPISDSVLIETNSRKIYYYQSGNWVEAYVPTTLAALTGDVNISAPANDQLLRYNTTLSKWQNATVSTGGGGTLTDPQSGYTWLIYKNASGDYKAKNGFTGTVPSGGSSTSMDTLWDWLKANYIQSGEPIGRGLIQFYKGTFTFTATGGAAAIDSTGWGTNTGAGPFIRGMKRDTKLVFTPSAATNSALTIDNQTDSGFADFDIAINSNVTNAIKVTANTAGEGAQRTLIENIKIRRSESDGPVVTGQRGIYMITPVYTIGGNVFFTTIRRVTTRFMDTGIELAGTADFNNTHAINIDDCGFWGSRRGINMGDRCSQNFISKILVQDVQPPPNDTIPIVEYAVRLGVQSRFNFVYNISADVVRGAGSCMVLLEDQSDYNKISGIINSGVAPSILDYSGRANNEYTNIISVGGNTYRSKEGRWQGGAYFTGVTDGTAGLTGAYMYGGSGLLSGPFAAPTGTQEGYVATANTHVFMDATEGISTRITTKGTPVAGDNVGLKTRFPITSRSANFRLYFRFRINTAKGATSDHRAWFGLWNNDGDVTSSNTWLPGIHGIGIGYDSTTTTGGSNRGATWHIVHNDATAGQTLFDEITTGTPPVGITNNNTIVHQCIIQSEETPTPRFLVNMDGGTLTSLTTGIPGSTIPLRLALGIEITSGTAHSIDIFDIRISQWK